MALYRDDLDPRTCDGAHVQANTTGGGPAPPPGAAADDLWFHARCHLDSPTWARYRDGVLTIQCARCERDVVAIHVARRPPAP